MSGQQTRGVEAWLDERDAGTSALAANCERRAQAEAEPQAARDELRDLLVSGQAVALEVAGMARRLRCGRRGKSTLVFAYPTGEWTKSRWDSWRRADFNGARGAARLGDLRTYDLRQTFASLLLAEGRAIHYVPSRSGTARR